VRAASDRADGPHAGEPLELSATQTQILYEWYRLDEEGVFSYRRGCWRAAQGTGKSPLGGAIALAIRISVGQRP